MLIQPGRCFFRSGLFALGLGVAALAAGFAQAPSDRRPVTVKDSIRMSLLGAHLWGGSDENPALFSPDGSQFVVVEQHGDLTGNTNEFSLLWFATGEIFARPVPKVLARFSSQGNTPGICDIRWADSRTLHFLAMGDGLHKQVWS